MWCTSTPDKSINISIEQIRFPNSYVVDFLQVLFASLSTLRYFRSQMKRVLSSIRMLRKVQHVLLTKKNGFQVCEKIADDFKSPYNQNNCILEVASYFNLLEDYLNQSRRRREQDLASDIDQAKCANKNSTEIDSLAPEKTVDSKGMRTFPFDIIDFSSFEDDPCCSVSVNGYPVKDRDLSDCPANRVFHALREQMEARDASEGTSGNGVQVAAASNMNKIMRSVSLPGYVTVSESFRVISSILSSICSGPLSRAYQPPVESSGALERESADMVRDIVTILRAYQQQRALAFLGICREQSHCITTPELRSSNKDSAAACEKYAPKEYVTERFGVKSSAGDLPTWLLLRASIDTTLLLRVLASMSAVSSLIRQSAIDAGGKIYSHSNGTHIG